MIPQEAWVIRFQKSVYNPFFNKYERPKYSSGRPYYPDDTNKQLNKNQISRMIRGEAKFYYSGGRQGKTLLMIDVDAHEDWQTDPEQLRDYVIDLFGSDNVFVVKSTRGFNLFVKWEYCANANGLCTGYWRSINDKIGALESALKINTAHYKSVVEIKGKITCDHKHYGTLAKLPCMPDWNEQRLQEFIDVPVMGESFVDDMTAVLIDLNESTAAQSKNNVEPVKSIKSGSCDTLTISDEDIDSVEQWRNECYQDACRCRAMSEECGRKDTHTSVDSFQDLMVVLGICKKYQKEKYKGQMGNGWIKCIWNKLKKVLKTAFNDSRLKAMRNTMSNLGMIHWVSNQYYFNKEGFGKAMEWSLMLEYDAVNKERGEGRSIIQSITYNTATKNLRPMLIFGPGHHNNAPDDVEMLIGRLNRWENAKQEYILA